MPKKPSPLKGRLKPQVWKTGPDPVLHKQYLTWLQQKNQANFRKEHWDLPFEVWLDMWRPYWHLRGRGSGEYCMTRTNLDGAWTQDNVEIVTRKEHVTRQAQYKVLTGRIKGYKQRKQNAISN